MAVIQQTGAAPAAAGRGFNAFSLRELVKRRIPGYDDTEYLSEVNAAYNEVWQEIMQLDELYFTDFTTVTVNTQSDTFDFYYNINGALSAAIPRLHQIHRIRIQIPANIAGSGASQSMLSASPRHLNDSEFLARSQQQQQMAVTTPPYLYVPFGINAIKFAQPLPVGAQIEVAFTFGLLDLQIISIGTVTTSANTVTGTSTLFTQLAPPDLQSALPNSTSPSESQVDAEVILNGLVYLVTGITSNTALTTAVAPPAIGASVAYVLASVPEFPAYAHRLVADIATRNMLSTPADDSRFMEWAQIAGNGITRMKNTLMQRQRQENAKKGRFPYGVVRRARFFGVK